MYKNKIYLAGPFFNEQQLSLIKQTKELLLQNATVDADHIFLPMEQDEYSQFEFGSLPWQQQTFNNDVRHIHQADCLVAILDYTTTKDGNLAPDPGTIFEIGVAYQANIPVILLQFEKTDSLNLMLAQSYTHFFNGNVEKIKDYDFNLLIHQQEDINVI